MPCRSKTLSTPACAMPRANPPPSARPRRGAAAAVECPPRRAARFAAYKTRRLPIGPLGAVSREQSLTQQFARHEIDAIAARSPHGRRISRRLGRLKFVRVYAPGANGRVEAVEVYGALVEVTDVGRPFPGSPEARLKASPYRF